MLISSSVVIQIMYADKKTCVILKKILFDCAVNAKDEETMSPVIPVNVRFNDLCHSHALMKP